MFSGEHIRAKTENLVLLYYRPRTKLWKGNVFSCVSVCSKGVPVQDSATLVQLGPHCTGSPTPPPPHNMLKLVHNEGQLAFD